MYIFVHREGAQLSSQLESLTTGNCVTKESYWNISLASLPGVSDYDLSSGVNLPPPTLPPSLPLLFSHLYSLLWQQQLPLDDGPAWLILYKFCSIPGEPSRLLYFLITSDSEQRILQPS